MNKIKLYVVVLFGFIYFNCHSDKNKLPTNLAYQNKLNSTKKYYPFANWRKSYKDGLLQYTEMNCNKAEEIFDDLITDLIAVGEKANEETKIKLFKTAILKTNDLNAICEEALIETGEREELCELTNKITEACGLNPKKYGSGEGLASEWRDW